ncbi:MAG: TRAP transporter small permease [Moorellales bacterium]
MPDKPSPNDRTVLAKVLQASGWSACVILVFMMMITVADVFMRFLFARPIVGANELVELSMVCLSALAIAWCAVNVGHISVDLVVGRLSPRAQAVFDSANFLLGAVVGAIIGVRCLAEAVFVRGMEGVTAVLEITQWPFYVILGAGYLVLVAAAINLFRRALKGVKKA